MKPDDQLSLFESDSYLKFKKYDAENPQIWEAFKKYTFESINKGFKHFSAEFVFNVIRWETSISGNDAFKVNNNWKSWYSRKFMQEYPDHSGFFQLRNSKADNLNLKDG